MILENSKKNIEDNYSKYLACLFEGHYGSSQQKKGRPVKTGRSIRCIHRCPVVLHEQLSANCLFCPC